MNRAILAAALLLAPVTTSAVAGPLSGDVRAIRDGKGAFTFDARPDVWGDGHGIFVEGNSGRRNRPHLENGPIRVLLEVRGGRVTDLDASVGGRPEWTRGAVDLGHRAVPEAVEFLLDLAATGDGRVAEEVIAPAALGRDAVTWPRMLEIARMDGRPRDVRKAAVFWLGQAAGDRVAGELERFIETDGEDLEVREHAVFAVSQRDPDEAFPILMRVIRSNGHPELRRKALFWLSELDDPRVIGVLEEILTGR